jgi:GrpB-like predicted nucleotidyltransferase (UPF0157 family)
VGAERSKKLDEHSHRSLALWAAECADHALPHFEGKHPTDARPRDAIKACRSWARGEIRAGAARVAASAAHAAARAADDPAAIAAARAAGHAAATAHSAGHARAAAAYAIKAAAAGGGAAELEWQDRRLPESLRPIVVVDYDPEWPRQFDRVREALLAAAAGIAVSVEHVGSTAVPGLASKPVIDVDLVVESPSTIAAVIERLDGLGYEHVGDLGIPDREAFRRPPAAGPGEDGAGPLQVDHHLYVVCRGGAELARHLAFRDSLRSDQALAREYAELKRSLAATLGHDREAYTEGKTEFVRAALGRAGAA